jgi:cyclopropane fatty-acyl-phospholipid synthase-like methyltransferase
MEWENFWNTFPNQFSKDDFFRQVGKTFQGKPISTDQWKILTGDIIQKTNLTEEDDVLDLCCGNGFITSTLAPKTRQIVGVDFSKPLIDIAKEFHGAANTRFYCMSALDMTPQNLHLEKPFDKIYMYEALQHFSKDQFTALLEVLLQISTERSVILLSSIPHKHRIWKFYDTPEKRCDYIERKRQGRQTLGTWWSYSFIRKACTSADLRCEFLPQPLELHTSHYRFDVRITRR